MIKTRPCTAIPRGLRMTMCLTDILQDLENSGPCTILCFNRINIPREDVLPLLLKVVFLSLSCEEILAVSVCLEKKGNSYWV